MDCSLFKCLCFPFGLVFVHALVYCGKLSSAFRFQFIALYRLVFWCGLGLGLGLGLSVFSFRYSNWTGIEFAPALSGSNLSWFSIGRVSIGKTLLVYLYWSLSVGNSIGGSLFGICLTA